MAKVLSEQELISLKEDMEGAKERLLKFKGQVELLKKQMKTTWKVDDLKQADKKILEFQKEYDDLTVKITKAAEKLYAEINEEE